MTNKTLINKRFIEAVTYLISELKTENKSSIAQKINIKSSKFSEILNNRMNIGIEDLAVFTQTFKFDANYILSGKGKLIINNEYKEETTNNVVNEPLPKPLHFDSELLETQRKLIKYQEEKIADLERRLLKNREGKETGS